LYTCYFCNYLTICQTSLVIINADDFGYSKEVNNAICNSFDNGIISSTTLLVNMPGFKDAIEKINTNPLIKNNVGLHINLVEGFPLSDLIKKQKRFCDQSGKFAYQRNQAVFSLHADEKKAIEFEVKAQIERALDQGITISHVDSHHATHTEWSISKIILNVLGDYQIEKIRIARNLGAQRGRMKEMYKFAFNSYLRFKKFKGVDFFGDLEDFFYSFRNRDFDKKSIEIMVHPVAVENGIVRDLNCDNITEKLMPVLQKFRIVGYSEL
jgi:chitin disaccharide deacetylase